MGTELTDVSNGKHLGEQVSISPSKKRLANIFNTEHKYPF